MKRRHVFNGDMREIHLVLTPLEEARLKALQLELMYPEPGGPDWDELKRNIGLLAQMTGNEEEYEKWLEQPLPF